MEQVKIFYSWQSDLPNNTNRSFIEKALEDGVKKIRNDDSIEVEPVVDRDTKGTSGTVNIAETILKKIEDAHIFVCDISIINQKSRSRKTPNPNVLYELGFASKSLGKGRIILVFNTSFGKIEDLPFDLRGDKVLTYAVSEETQDKAISRKTLERGLENAVRAIIANEKFNSQQVITSSSETLEEAFINSANVFQVKKIVLNEIKNTCEKVNSLESISTNSYVTPEDIEKYMGNCLDFSSESLNLFALGCSEGELIYSKIWGEALSLLADSVLPNRTIDEIRHFTALLHFYAGGIASVASEKYENLASLLKQKSVIDYRGNQSTSAYYLVPYRVVKEDVAKNLPSFGRYHTPLNQYLFINLKEPLRRFISNDQIYKEAFYRFEYLFALASAIEVQKIWGGDGYYVPVGSYCWESYLMEISSTGTQFVTKQTDFEIEQQVEKWRPFQAGLFGNSWEKFLEIKKKADENLINVVQQFFHMFNP